MDAVDIHPDLIQSHHCQIRPNGGVHPWLIPLTFGYHARHLLYFLLLETLEYLLHLGDHYPGLWSKQKHRLHHRHIKPPRRSPIRSLSPQYDIPAALICRHNDTLAPLGICYREVFLSYSLDLSTGYGISFLKYKEYHAYLDIATYLHCPTISLLIYKACPLPGPRSGHRRPQQTSIPTQISQTNMETDQVYPIDVGPGPIIPFCCLRSPLQRRNQYQPTWSPTKYLQRMLGIPQSQLGQNHLHRHTPRLLPTLPNRRRGPTNFPQPLLWISKYCQPTPGHSNPASWPLRIRLKY